MPRYDEFYDRPGRYDSPSPIRSYRRWHRYRVPVPDRPEPLYADDFVYDDDFGERRPMGTLAENQERMGMRDFSERYGRYSGGSPYSYEYSERTIYHINRYPGPTGFSRPLREDRFRRGRRGGGPRYGAARPMGRWRRPYR